jgi:hypothetical protein
MAQVQASYSGQPDSVVDTQLATTATTDSGTLITAKYSKGPPEVVDRIYEFDTTILASAFKTTIDGTLLSPQPTTTLSSVIVAF